MLQSFRRASSSWVILGLLGLIMIAFIVTGFGTGGGGIGDLANSPDRLATVGSEVITEQQLVNRLNRELKTAQRDHPSMDMAQFIQLGAFEDALEKEIIDRAQLAFAARHRISASKRMVDGEIAAVPAFQNAAGAFDEAGFRTALAQAGVAEADLRRDVMLDVLRDQMLGPISQGPRLPGNVVNFYANLLLETRTGAVAVVPSKLVGPGGDPTPAEIATYYKANEAKYRIPERRVLRYAMFGWSDIVNTVKATDAEIEAAYKQAGAAYEPRETRTVAQLTLPDQAAANSFIAKVKAGTSFDAAVSQAGFAAGDVIRAEGSKEDVRAKVAAEIAEAAFKTAQGAIIGPIRSPLGWHVARVEKVAVIPAKPLAAVRNELASAIQQRKAVDALDVLVTRIEDQIEDGASFEEVAKTNNLQVVETPPVTATGAAPETDFQLSTEAKVLVKAAFEISTDDDPQVETITAGQRYAMLVMPRIVEPTVPPLAQLQDRVKADLIAERSSQRAKRIAEQIVVKVNGGTPLREALAGAGVALPPVQAIKMRRADANRAGAQLPPPVRVIFALPQGKARTVPTPNSEGWFISVAETITPAEPKEVPLLARELKRAFEGFLRDEYGEQFIRSLEKEVGVRRNEVAITRVKRRLQTGSAQ